MRISQILRLCRQYYSIRKSGLFDSQYYVAKNGSFGRKLRLPLIHFLVEGGAAGFSPHPLFDSRWYLSQNPHVKAKLINPLIHYLRVGALQGRNPNPYFDTSWYLDRYADVAEAGVNPLVHYLKHGAAEGRNPSPDFDTKWYLQAYPDVTSARTNPLSHFLQNGGSEVPPPAPERFQIASMSNIVTRGDGCLEFINGDPQLYLSFVTKRYTNQLCLMLSLHMQSIEGDYLEPCLYIDYGGGIFEEYAFYLARADEDHWHAFIPMPGLIKAIRLDPSTRSGVVRRPIVSIRPVDLNLHINQLLSGKVTTRMGLTKLVDDVARLLQRGCFSITKAGSSFIGYTDSILLNVVAKCLNFTPSINQLRYSEWIKKHDLITEKDVRSMSELMYSFKMKPKFSVILPVYNTRISFLKQAIESVLTQTYPYFELCIADDASPNPEVRAVIKEFAHRDKRVKYIFRPENGHISECSNSALSLAEGEFVALLDHDDLIPMHALWTAAYYINIYPHSQVLFSDEDKIDEDGVRQLPYFKGSFDEFLLYGHNMVTHLGIYRRSLIQELGGFRRGYEGSQDYDLILRSFEKRGAKHIVHIPHLLYHWRMTAGSTSVSADQKSYAILAAQKAINDHFARCGLPFHSVPGRTPGTTAIAMSSCREVLKQKVSIIIPTRDGGVHLEACIESVQKHKDPEAELLVINNGSKDVRTVEYLRKLANCDGIKILSYDMEFNFSKINNFAVRHASGSLLCFLNDDTEVVSTGWIDRARTLLSIAAIGAVGARLLYPDKKLQHFGIHLGLGLHKVAGLPHAGIDATEPGYSAKAILMQQFSAVTAACLFIRREDFLKVGGFEPDLAIAFNDVDLCLKVRETGLQIVCDPDIELIHHESKSRGLDMLAPAKRQRLDREAEWMRRKWGKKLDADPFFNPNLDHMRGDYSVAFPPRIRLPWRMSSGEQPALGDPVAHTSVENSQATCQ